MTVTTPQLRKIELIIFSLAIITIVVQAFHPAWRSHALVDGYFAYYDKISYFFKYGTLTDIPINEYQPGAVLFFLLVSPVLAIVDTRNSYLNGLIATNALLMLGYAWYLARTKRVGPVALFGGLLLLGGPVLLFRFEMLVFLLTAAGVVMFNQKKWPVSGIFLGIGTMVKVYPVLILPVLALVLLRKKSWSATLRLILGFGAGMLLTLGTYLLVFRVNVADVIDNVTIHANKPLAIESVSGSLTLWNAALNGQQPAETNNLIHGVHPRHFLAPLNVYLYAWLIPTGFFFLWWFKNKQLHESVTLAVIVMLLIFLSSVSQLGPQYLHWALLFIPLLPWRKIKSAPLAIAWLAWVGLLLVFNHFFFPVFYSQVLEFFAYPIRWLGFSILLVRNAALVMATVYGIKLLKAQVPGDEN